MILSTVLTLLKNNLSHLKRFFLNNLSRLLKFQTNANIDINLYSDLENGFQFLFGYSLCLNPLVYAFRSAHFKEGFRRVLTTCWKPTPQDDNVQCFRYFFLFMSQHEVEEKLRSENFAATQTTGFDNAE